MGGEDRDLVRDPRDLSSLTASSITGASDSEPISTPTRGLSAISAPFLSSLFARFPSLRPKSDVRAMLLTLETYLRHPRVRRARASAKCRPDQSR